MLKLLKDKLKLSAAQIIALSFVMIILMGASLLTLPISSRSGEWTSFFDASFTAVSATCVTGLVVFDTFTHWSVFGQLVILAMIQIGGLGFMTVITMFSIFTRRRITLHERIILVQSAGTMRLTGIVRLIKRILLGTLFFELSGAVLLAFRFCPDLGIKRGLYYSVFHAVSSFCNAGFDLFGCYAPYSSLTAYSEDIVVNLAVCALVVIGGLGFLVWDDIFVNKLNVRKYSLHTKIVLCVTASLLLLGFVMFFFFENDASMQGMNTGNRVIASFFQSVTTRTAGFNTVDLAALSDSGTLASSVLMLIGGSPGSTAGGIKTTTIAVLIAGAIASSRKNKYTEIFKRRLEDGITKQAASILMVYTVAVLVCTMLICELDAQPLRDVLFEVTSAAGTVGLSTGITRSLCGFSRLLLMILMYGGRVGGLTLMLVFAEKKKIAALKRPTEKILIG